MTITETFYNILEDARVAGKLTIPAIWTGLAAEYTDTKDGLITLFPLPTTGANYADGLTNQPYQIDVWSKDMYSSEIWKEEVVSLLLGTAGMYDGKAMVFNMIADLGVIPEEDGKIWHYAITYNIRYNRR